MGGPGGVSGFGDPLNWPMTNTAFSWCGKPELCLCPGPCVLSVVGPRKARGDSWERRGSAPHYADAETEAALGGADCQFPDRHPA